MITTKTLRIAAMSVILGLAACATPTKEEVDRADIGPRPDNAQQIVRDHFAQTLFDPYSAVYTFSYGPERGVWVGLGTDYGWIVCGTLNAKNRLGGYVGAKRFRVLIAHGRVVENASAVGDLIPCTMND
jgi:hypothetical protein